MAEVRSSLIRLLLIVRLTLDQTATRLAALAKPIDCTARREQGDLAITCKPIDDTRLLQMRTDQQMRWFECELRPFDVDETPGDEAGGREDDQRQGDLSGIPCCVVESSEPTLRVISDRRQLSAQWDYAGRRCSL